MKLLQLALIGLLGLSPPAGSPLSALRDGDIIFQTSRSAQSEAIQRATNSRYSHVGMIVHRAGRAYVLEAADTVRYTPLAEWVQQGVERRFVVRRLRDASSRLTPAATARLLAAGAAYVSKPYDRAFEWSDERMYCSELVWKAYKRGLDLEVGKPRRLREFDLADSLVSNELRERYGDRIPLDEQMVSPQDMFESDLLVTVAER